MNIHSISAHPSFYAHWVRATFLGWLLGFAIILIGAVIGDLLGAGGGESIIGLGMGAGVGYTQGRSLSRWQIPKNKWMWSSIAGMGFPFIVSDIVYVVWGEFSLTFPILLAATAFGGLLTGLLQQRILSLKFERSLWWIPTSIIAWSLAGASPGLLIEIAGNIPGRWIGFFVNLGIILFGGVLLGVITGASLGRILRD